MQSCQIDEVGAGWGRLDWIDGEAGLSKKALISLCWLDSDRLSAARLSGFGKFKGLAFSFTPHWSGDLSDFFG